MASNTPAKQEDSKAEAAGPIYQCEIVERPAQAALSIRSQVSPFAIVSTIGESAMAIFHMLEKRALFPLAPLFVAYHGFDGQVYDLEIGFPFESGIKGRNNIKASKIPGGESAVYYHVGPMENFGNPSCAGTVVECKCIYNIRDDI